MTTIAVKKFEHTWYMAGDTFMTEDDRITIPVTKIRKFDNALIGGAGNIRDLHSFFSFCEVCQTEGGDFLNASVLKEVLLLRLARFATSRAEWLKPLEEGDKVFNLSLLIGVKDKMFWAVAHQLEIHEVTQDYWAIGSGASYALGALEGGASATGAVTIASSFDSHTGGEIITLN